MKRAKVLSAKQLKKVMQMQIVSRNRLRNEALLMVSFYLGLRVKEISALKLNQMLDSSAQLVQEIALEKGQSKNKKGERTLYITNPKLRESLERYIQERKTKKNYPMEPPLRGPFFLSEHGGHFTPNALQQLFSKMYKDAGLNGCSSHSGRRSYITNLSEKGIDIRSIQILAGHSSISTTQVYIEENPIRLADINKNL